MFELTGKPILPQDYRKLFNDDRAGGFVFFEGVVRNSNNGRDVKALEYDAYPELCRLQAQQIIHEAEEKFSVQKIIIAHRTGHLQVGDVAVWIAVSAQHRDAAFRACRFLIDEIKIRLPIWKKEFYSDGDSGWVNCEKNIISSTVFEKEPYYSRQTALKEIGDPGQKRLREAKVLVVGAGGLGCAALTSLAEAGVGIVGICEFDKLEIHNLHRQLLYSADDVGKAKIELAVGRLKKMNPFIRVLSHPVCLSASNIHEVIENYDCILDCTDNFKSKYLLNDAAYLSKKVLIQANIYQWDGEIHTYYPGQSKTCLRCLWQRIPQPECVGNCEEAGVIGAVPNIVGHWQALEALKYFLGSKDLLLDRVLMINFQTNQIQSLAVSPQATCPLCGATPTITSIEAQNYESEVPVMSLEVDLSNIPLKDWSQYEFIDIREEQELFMEPVNMIKTQHLPMSEFEQWQFAFDPKKQYLIFCAGGVRSLHIVELLHEQGISNAFSISNGVPAIKYYFEHSSST